MLLNSSQHSWWIWQLISHKLRKKINEREKNDGLQNYFYYLLMYFHYHKYKIENNNLKLIRTILIR